MGVFQDTAGSVARGLSQRQNRNIKEGGIKGLLALCALISILTTLGILLVLGIESSQFFLKVSPLEFFTGRQWAPLFEPQHFGVLPLLAGTMMVTVGAGLLAIPVGLAVAIYLSEYASERTRSMIKPVLEVLAGVPTVVYGYFALTFITPFVVRGVFPEANIFNAASASIVVGIMILPLVASLSDDAFRAVPESLRQAGYAMGATKLEVSLQVVLPAALSGVLASFILALSRAVGETMAVAMAAGSTPVLTWNPLESIQTITGYIVQVSLGDTPHGTVEYQSIFAVGALLFAITLGMNVVAHKVLKRFREVYD